ncbi:MAG: hypothetical protein NBV68_10645 [Erythrobacter sp.]|uniref:hypothetical protein n=1 Tax=Erythrobacter sp. TaxID=1042 RepID=UPI0025DD1096|nr:hypothetical protein [Erythrobacter sp.]MCL9999828.1 hypothetical protein [Erythrobacter sp.]
MSSEGGPGGNQGGKLGVVVAIVTILSGLAGTYAVAKGELLAVCTSTGLSWCKQSGASGTGDGGDYDGAGTTTVDPPQPVPGIAISVKPSLSTDAVPAAALMQGLKGALGPVGSAASGYQIEGVVSGFSNPVPRRSQFTFSWTIRRGSVVERCNDVPVAYDSSMAGAAAHIVSTAVAPAIAESVKYRDVRCS